MALWHWLFGIAVHKVVTTVADRMVTDPLAADGKPIDTTWDNETANGLELVLHRAEMELSQLREFLPRLGRCFDHGLEESQLEILQHRVGRMAVKKTFHGYYSVVQRREVTNLEIMIEHQLRGTYVIVLRGIGPAMEVLRHELERFQAPSTPAPVAAPLALEPLVTPEPAPVVTEIPADGKLRLAPDRSAWRAQLPFAQGSVLGHAIYVMVENNRMEADIQPQQSDHQLLMQIYAQLPMIIEQVMKLVVEHISDPISLRSLCEPMICLYAGRPDPLGWTFYLKQQHPAPVQMALEFRGTQLLR
jgi:hypothetical protein